MVMQNKNFEEFMDFRDMIQGGSLDDRMEMVNYMSNKPVMARQGGGPAMMEEEDMNVEPVARSKDFLVKAYGDAALTMNPNFFDKFYEEQQELNIGIENTKDMLRSQMGLSSMPIANASLGGFLKDLGINIGRAVVQDVVGAGVGAVADSFSPDVGDFFGSSAGKGATDILGGAGFDLVAHNLLGVGEGPSATTAGIDFALGSLGDYLTTSKQSGERDFFGPLFEDDDNPATQQLRAKRERRRQSNQDAFDSPDNFLKRVGQFRGVLDQEGKLSKKGTAKRLVGPSIRTLLSYAAEQSAIPTDPNQGGLRRPSRFIPDLNRRATRRLPKRDRSTITSEQARQLKTRGFFIDTKTGERVTAQDFIGGVSYLPSTQSAKQGGLVSLNKGGQPDPTFVAYKKWLDAHGGVAALDQQALRQGKVNVLAERDGTGGPQIFSYDQGGERGAGLYDDYVEDYQDFPFAYREHPDYNSQWSTGGILPDKNFVNQIALDTQRKEIPIIDPDEDNENFVLSLLFPDRAAKQGGLVNRARGGDFSGMIGGDGHGMEDNVQMPIVSDGEQVATLAVSPKEYVVDAYTMAALGNGNPDEGAKIMDQTIKGIRQRAYGTKKQPNEINGTKALQSGLTSLG